MRPYGWQFDPTVARGNITPLSTSFTVGIAAAPFASAYLSTSLVFTSSFSLLPNTVDGSDNREITLYGGGSTATDGSRGGHIRISGNEASGVGSISMRTGTASGASLVLDCYSTNGVVALKNQNTHIVWVDATGMHLKLSDNQIDTGTSDGSDSASVTINAGGAYNSGGSRGAFLRMYGNENAVAGSTTLSAGNASSAYLSLAAPASNGYFRYIINGIEEWSMLAGTTLVFTTASATIRSNTSDGSDNLAVRLCGGGAFNQSGTRGAFLYVNGNEVSGVGGNAHLSAGDATNANLSLTAPASNGYIRIQPGGNDEWLFLQGRDLAFGGGNATIRAYTNDGSDNRTLTLCGGGAAGSTRGATLYLLGNEAQGYVLLSAGAVSTGSIYFDLNHASASIFFRNVAGNAMWQITASGALTQAATNGTDIVFNTSGTAIRMGTSDGADDKYLTIAGGGAASTSRGAYIELYGNEHGATGRAKFSSGGATPADITMASDIEIRTNGGTTRFVVKSAGNLEQDASGGGFLKFQRANTTIDFAGTMGDSTKVVGTDAPVDWVEVKIAGTTRYMPAYAA